MLSGTLGMRCGASSALGRLRSMVTVHAAPGQHAPGLRHAHGRQQILVAGYQGDEIASGEAGYATMPEIRTVTFDEFKTLPRNEVSLVGRLGSDINLRNTAAGKFVGSVNLAVNNRDNNRDAPATWYRLVLWEELAERAHNQLAKGSLVWVRGNISVKTQELPDGLKRQSMEVSVRELHMVAPSNQR